MSGIAVRARVELDEPSIRCAVFADAAEFEIGPDETGFDLIASESGLRDLVTVGREALRLMREKQAEADESKANPPATVLHSPCSDW